MIRYAVLAAVSTKGQAENDKKSLEDQVKIARQSANAQGGKETAGPFVLDGYSRTDYEDLSLAIKEIPPLAAMIEAAEADKFDALAMDNFDRLGDLAPMIRTRFKKLRKQLYSARQSGKMIAPDKYNPYADDATSISIHVEGIIQSYRINKLRRGWEIGIPERAAVGLHPLSLAFGYKVGEKGGPAIIVPQRAELVRKMKDWFLAGETWTEITRLADATGIKPPRSKKGWSVPVIARILVNPFYAGKTAFGRTSTVNGKKIPNPPSEWTVGHGKHEPLWDEATHIRLVNETERRRSGKMRNRKYAISGLLRCAVCGQGLYRHGKVDGKYENFLSCKLGKAHVIIPYSVAHRKIASTLAKELRWRQANPPDHNDMISQLERELVAQNEKRKLVQDGYEKKLYNDVEAGKRLSEIEKDINKLIGEIERYSRDSSAQGDFDALYDNLEDFEEWVLQGDPLTVNRLLSALCEQLIIDPDFNIKVMWRGFSSV